VEIAFRETFWLRAPARFHFSLPTLGTLGHLELHGLAFLQAFETTSLNR
jgi:hypothetical protein